MAAKWVGPFEERPHVSGCAVISHPSFLLDYLPMQRVSQSGPSIPRDRRVEKVVAPAAESRR